jgi:hypothetical protein
MTRPPAASIAATACSAVSPSTPMTNIASSRQQVRGILLSRPPSATSRLSRTTVFVAMVVAFFTRRRQPWAG